MEENNGSNEPRFPWDLESFDPTDPNQVLSPVGETFEEFLQRKGEEAPQSPRLSEDGFADRGNWQSRQQREATPDPPATLEQRLAAVKDSLEKNEEMLQLCQVDASIVQCQKALDLLKSDCSPNDDESQAEEEEDQQLCLTEQIIKFTQNVTAIRNHILSRDCLEVVEVDEEDHTLMITDLPDELLLKVFSYLSLAQLCQSVALVCRRLYRLSSDPSLWQYISLPMDSVLEPHWLCYLISKSPQLKNLSLRGDLNIRPESLIVFTRYCGKLQSVDFGFCSQFTGDMLCNLVNNCPMIESVNFEGCTCVNEEWIGHLCKLKNVKSVNISHCNTVLDENIIALANELSGLEHLNIDGNSFITDLSVTVLCEKQKSSLTKLQLDGAECTNRSIHSVALCDNLTVLTISFCEQLTSDCIPSIARLCQLTHLQIRKSQLISTEAFCHLFSDSSMENLIDLDLSECVNVEDSVVKLFCQRCPNLSRLTLGWCLNITDEGLTAIIDNCRHIVHLDLLGIDQIVGESFAQLPEKLPQLTFLNLSQCNQINDNLLLEVLQRIPTLTAINFYHEDFRRQS